MEPVTFGPKPVEDETPVSPQHLGDLLHLLEPRARGARAPGVQELTLEQIGPHRLQVAAQELLERGLLFLGEVLRTFEQAPAGPCQHGALSLGLEVFDLRGADLVDGLAHVTHDAESVQDMHRLSRLLDPKVGFPHVAVDEPKPDQGLLRALLPDPEQSIGVRVDLMGECDVFVLPFTPSDLVDADRGHPVEVAVLQAPGGRHLDRTNHTVPAVAVNLGHLFPTQPFGPTGQKPGAGGRQVALALRPRYPLDPHALGAVHLAQRVEEEDGDSPQVDELKPPHRQGVVSRLSLATARAQRSIPRPRPDLHAQHHVASLLEQLHTSVHEARLALDPIENSLDLHPALLSLIGVPHKHPYQDRERDASFNPSLCQVATRHRRCSPGPRRPADYPQILRTNRKPMAMKDKRSTSYERQPRDCQRAPGSSHNSPFEGSRGFGLESHIGTHRLPIDTPSYSEILPLHSPTLDGKCRSR